MRQGKICDRHSIMPSFIKTDNYFRPLMPEQKQNFKKTHFENELKALDKAIKEKRAAIGP